ncbi:MAG: polyprenyl synthetase family protein [Ardenticatenaceae bacterium]|nr:polyprenyl synthetase family protein [Anaerolineales bacterium]MCB9005960.1 polyprenyl synthetase family protein [Ardenticatenaceae bacterium]
MFLSNNYELLEPVAQFISCELLAPLDWQTFSGTFAAYLRRRRNTPSAYVDLFPTLACLAAGGESVRAISVTAAWTLFILAARLFDDLADGQQLALEWRHFKPTTTTSMALFALGAANSALAQADSRIVYEEVSLAFNQALALAAKSQQLETENLELSIEQYLGTIATKTGFIFAVGAWAGGMIATKEPCQTTVQGLHDYGLNVGIMDQIYDDCQDLAVDLAQGIWTLPVLYAMSQAKSNKRHELQVALTSASRGEAGAVETAVSLITTYDAIPWSLMAAAAYQQRALAAIEALSPENKSYLVEYAQRNNAQLVL